MSRGARNWCARGQYPDKEPFMMGTVVLPLEARHDEIMAALNAKWEKFMPHDRPPVWEAIAGAMYFYPEK